MQFEKGGQSGQVVLRGGEGRWGKVSAKRQPTRSRKRRKKKRRWLLP